MQGNRANSHRLRLGRYSEAGRIYFVTSRCHDSAHLFIDAELAGCLVDESKKQEGISNCSSLAFVAMPDHFHWLMQVGETHSLQTIVGSLKGRSARSINMIRGVSNKVWQSGFYDHAVRKEEDLENLAHYILLNPVRAGMVERFDEYPYSYSVWHHRG